MKQLVIVLAILLVVITGCSTTHNPAMLQDQAQMIRNNWENIKLGASIEEVKNLMGPPSIYRVRDCNCSECSPPLRHSHLISQTVPQKVEKLWYVYKSVKEPNIFIYLAFRHGKLVEGWADAPAGVIVVMYVLPIRELKKR